MQDIPEKIQKLSQELKNFGLRPLLTSTTPKNEVWALECLFCGEFAVLDKKIQHEKTCKNEFQDKLDEAKKLI